jgi:hypothetical protein
VFATLALGQTYVPNSDLNAIAYPLERVLKGEHRRLIIGMIISMPRSLKSTMTSVALPRSLWADIKRILFRRSSKKHSNDFRGVVVAFWYQKLVPATQNRAIARHRPYQEGNRRRSAPKLALRQSRGWTHQSVAKLGIVSGDQ